MKSNKIEVDLISFKKLMDEVNYFVEGIIDAARNGDDGYLVSMEKQQKEIKTLVGEYLLEFIPKTQNIAPIGKPYTNENALSAAMSGKGSPTHNNTLLWQNKINARLRKWINEDENISKVDSKYLTNYFEVEYIMKHPEYKDSAFNVFPMDTFRVMVDIADEIIELRKKNSQTNLFQDEK